MYRDVECDALAFKWRRIVRVNKFAALWGAIFAAIYRTGKRVTRMGLAAGYERRGVEVAPREKETAQLGAGRAIRTSILLSVAGRKCWIYDDGAHTLSPRGISMDSFSIRR